MVVTFPKYRKENPIFQNIPMVLKKQCKKTQNMLSFVQASRQVRRNEIQYMSPFTEAPKTPFCV